MNLGIIAGTLLWVSYALTQLVFIIPLCVDVTTVTIYKQANWDSWAYLTKITELIHRVGTCVPYLSCPGQYWSHNTLSLKYFYLCVLQVTFYFPIIYTHNKMRTITGDSITYSQLMRINTLYSKYYQQTGYQQDYFRRTTYSRICHPHRKNNRRMSWLGVKTPLRKWSRIER